MKSHLFLAFCLLVLSVLLQPVKAQEIQMPILPEKHIEVIDQTLQKQLHLFPEYEQFVEARLFQSSDSSWVLEITYQQGNHLLKKRLPYSAKDLQAFRHTLLTRLNALSKPPQKLDQSGRVKFLVSTTTLSFGFYGWAIPSALNVQNEKVAVATYMFTAAAGFYLPYYLTKNIPVTNGVASFALYGATRGLVHGYLIPFLFDDSPESRTILGSMTLASLGEMVGGFALARTHNFSSGTSELMGIFGDYGLLTGAYVAVLADFFEDDLSRAGSASLLLGSFSGMMVGKSLAGRVHYTPGDVHVTNALTRLGIFLPSTVAYLFDSKDLKIYAGVSMLGTAVGLGLGHQIAKTYDFSTGEGRFVKLGEVAGGLLGFGLAYLLTPSNGANRGKYYLASASLGATLGFWFMYNSFKQKASQRALNRFSFDFDVTPATLLLVRFNKKNRDLPLPIAHLRFYF